MSDSTFDEIMSSITSKLTGDPEHDYAYLVETSEQYKDHPLAQEILRAVGRLLCDVLPPDVRDEIFQYLDNNMAAGTSVLDEATFQAKSGNIKKALEILEPYAHKLQEDAESGLFADDSVNCYFNYDDSFQQLLLELILQPEKTIRPAMLPFTRTFALLGGILYEDHRHDEAITWLERAIKWNPTDCGSYFEIAENYKVKKDFDQAEIWHDKAYPFLATPTDLARWYRAKGFCAIERGELELAAAEFMVSLAYEPSQLAMSEILYIKMQYGEDYTNMDMDQAVFVVSNHELPIGPAEEVVDAWIIFYKLATANEQNDLAEHCLKMLVALTHDEDFYDMPALSPNE